MAGIQLAWDQVAAWRARRHGLEERRPAGERWPMRCGRALADALRASWGALLKPAAFRGALCFAPSDGQKVRFTNPATWLGPWEPSDPDAARAEAARRYLATHGPATREDFARWLAKSPAVGGRIIAGLGDEVTGVEVAGEPYWALAADVPALEAAEPTATVRLLPAFDQYVIAATLHAERLMRGPHKRRVYRDQGWLTAVLCVGGRIDGAWRWERKGRRLEVEVEPFGARLGKPVRAAAADEAKRLAGYPRRRARAELDLRPPACARRHSAGPAT